MKQDKERTLKRDIACQCGYIICTILYMQDRTLQRHNTEKSKQIFKEKELCGLSSNFHIHVSVSDFYNPRIGLPILLQKNMWTDPGNI